MSDGLTDKQITDLFVELDPARPAYAPPRAHAFDRTESHMYRQPKASDRLG